jgi:hypothetical protein
MSHEQPTKQQLERDLIISKTLLKAIHNIATEAINGEWKKERALYRIQSMTYNHELDYNQTPRQKFIEAHLTEMHEWCNPISNQDFDIDYIMEYQSNRTFIRVSKEWLDALAPDNL